MFDIDKFLNGEQGIEVYNQRMFNDFRAWASRHGYTWRNGADPMSEELTEGDNHSLSTASGVRRYAEFPFRKRKTALCFFSQG